METLDIYATRPPNHNMQNGCASYTSRLVWCGAHYMEGQLFYANELSLLIDEIYGEKLSSFKVSHELKRFAELGYVDRVQSGNRAQTYYKYRVSQLGRKYMQMNGFGVDYKEAVV